MTELLAVKDLTKHFRQSGSIFTRQKEIVRAVDGVSFSLEEGKTLGIVGESGSGKTTTAFAILQLTKPTSGQVLFMQKDLTTLHRKALREIRRDLQVVFQDPYSSLNPRMTTGNIIAEPLIVHQIGTRSSRRKRVAELLELVGMDKNFVNRYPHEFSGGQRQRIGIARALALDPKLIICDEPVSALDVSIQAQILNLLKDIQDRLGIAYLFISHDLAVVRHMSDDIAVMREGKIVEMGSANQIYHHPQDTYTKELLAAVPRID